jgi:hypothetical protein
VTNSNEDSNITAPSFSGTVYKGVSTTLTVTSNAAGKVRFFVGGKRISTCLAVSTSGSYPNFQATCNWKPPVSGKQLLTATITPSDGSFSTANSSSSFANVLKRSNSR